MSRKIQFEPEAAAPARARRPRLRTVGDAMNDILLSAGRRGADQDIHIAAALLYMPGKDAPAIVYHAAEYGDGEATAVTDTFIGECEHLLRPGEHLERIIFRARQLETVPSPEPIEPHAPAFPALSPEEKELAVENLIKKSER